MHEACVARLYFWFIVCLFVLQITFYTFIGQVTVYGHKYGLILWFYALSNMAELCEFYNATVLHSPS